MKLIIKNLKQVEHNVEVSSDKLTVKQLKEEIEKVHGFDANQLKLLFNGVVLDDTKTLEDYKIQNENVIIMMNTKVKPQNVHQPPEQQPEKKDEPPKTEEKKPEAKQEPSKPQQPPQQEKPKQDYTNQINSLVDMGFERAQAEAAINAAKGRVELAIEFLYNGIPEGLEDVDMIEQGGDEGGEGAEVGEGGEGGDTNDNLLKKVASIAKVLCQNNPSALSTVLGNIQQTNPELMNLINENEDEFKGYLEQPLTQEDLDSFRHFQQEMGFGMGGGMGGGDSHHGHGHGRQIRISLTKEEEEAVKRLKELGNFSESDVLQAFFACEKNEEMTANYLFEQKMRDDDEMFGAKNNNNNNNNNQGGQGGQGAQGNQGGQGGPSA